MSSLLERMKATSKIKLAEVMTESKILQQSDPIATSVPMINVALSGKLDGGITSGLTVLAGPSKHYKTSFGLLMLKAYQDKFPDSITLFYDSEFGSPQVYWDSFGIDMSRVLHVPIKNVEELKFDLVTQLEGITPKDKVFIMIDSIGNLASKKEVDDARDSKSVADMTRAKQMKSLFRMATPYLTLNDIPLIAVNHTYETQEMFSRQVVSGGTGIIYSANTVWIIGRRQDKVGTEIKGYDFIINVEKSRFVKEKSKIPVSVSWAGGIQKWSGLLEVAVESGFVTKPKIGWYTRPTVVDDKNFREKDTMNKEFWDPIFNDTNFAEYIEEKFSVGYVQMEE
jgi:RecA/RadA recombinase